MIINSNETIAAIATAYGEGGIGIIRLSGSKSEDILKEIFIGKSLDVKNSKIKNRQFYYGEIVDSESQNHQVIDEVMVVLMKSPQTYTREDVVEIYCHGSIVSLKKILALVLRKGALQAEPGEFTKRAFLNGRIDLSQAEAVIDVVKAKTDMGFGMAVDQMQGVLSKTIGGIREKLIELLAEITVNIDYPDEDKEEETIVDLGSKVLKIKEEIKKLIDTADTGRLIKEGINVVIAGKPNVGKSSLLNTLLKESRAIVTEIPGTTRDTIEEYANINDIPVKLTDTAGIRETENEIEKIGIEKTKETFDKADLLILTFDASRDLEEDDKVLIKASKGMNKIIFLNKIDLEPKLDKEELQELIKDAEIIDASIIENKGIDVLEKKITSMVYDGTVKQSESVLINNVRHKELLIKADKELETALNMIDNREALDFIEVNVKQAYDEIGEITGDTINDDILNEVFSKFCVGK